MPRITATASQVIRYFFVGAIATFWWFFLMEFWATPDRSRPDKLVLQLVERPTPSAMVALGILIVILGSLLYGLHRLVVYPLVLRALHLSVDWNGATARRRWWAWPYGTMVEPEIKLERFFTHSVDATTRKRFVGWSNETHLYYVTLEVLMLSFLWKPRWPWLQTWTCSWWFTLGSLVALFGLVVLWDRQKLRMQDELRQAHDDRSTAPTTPPA